MNQTATYYNTTGLEGEALKKATESAHSQECAVLSLFKRYPNIPFRTHDVEHAMNRENRNMRTTSCQRAITNLTKRGLLVKSEKASGMGPYGRPVHYWILNPTVNVENA